MLTPHSHSSSIMYKSLLFIQAITSASCMHSYERKKVGKTVTTNCFTTNSVKVPNNLQQPKLIFLTLFTTLVTGIDLSNRLFDNFNSILMVHALSKKSLDFESSRLN